MERRIVFMTKQSRNSGFTIRAVACVLAAGTVAVLAASALSGCGSSGVNTSGLPNNLASLTQVTNGRILVITSGCAECHNRGKTDPSDTNWLAGFIGTANDTGQGACAIRPFKTVEANLTNDTTVGRGRYS